MTTIFKLLVIFAQYKISFCSVQNISSKKAQLSYFRQIQFEISHAIYSSGYLILYNIYFIKTQVYFKIEKLWSYSLIKVKTHTVRWGGGGRERHTPFLCFHQTERWPAYFNKHLSTALHPSLLKQFRGVCTGLGLI